MEKKHVGMIVIGLIIPLGLLGCGGPPDDAQTTAQVHKRMERRLSKGLDMIDATEQQKARIKVMAKDLATKGHQLKAPHEQARKQLLAQWSSPNPDRKAAHRIVDKQLDLMRKFVHQVVDRVADLHAVLTPQQRKDVSDKLEQLHEKRGRWFKRHHGWH